MLFLNGTSEEALIELINVSNQLDVPLRAGGLFYGTPRAIAGGYVSLISGTNYDNDDYQGYSSFEYKRVNLTKAFGTTRPVLKVAKTPQLVDLLPQINKTVGLNLLPSDINNAALTWGEINSQQNLQIIAADKSLGYEGRFVVQCILVRPILNEVLKRTALPVLTHPDPIVEGKKSVGMMTWGIDFTDYIDPTTALVQGRWRNHAQIVAVMAEKGFPNWPQSARLKLSIRPTKDVVGANTKYTHVIVQPDINTATHQGTAYFHINIQ